MLALTERLFHADPYLGQFEAEVVACRPAGDSFEVALDRTAFYATSGGQPHDTGRLAGSRVSDVVDADGILWHRVDREMSGRVHGEIDWERRFDHMQQHTGQHILSQAFIETAGAETVSFHLGAERATIDLNQADLSEARLLAAEARANGIVFEDREVRIHWTTREQVGRFPLRKPPQVDGPIRIVEIAEFDYSACGGTHVARSGAVGLIKLVGSERYKGGQRIEFVCGGRALADYGLKHQAVRSLAGRFSTHDREVEAAVGRLEQEARDLRRRVKELDEARLDREAQFLAAEAPSAGAFRVVREVRSVTSAEELKGLAGRLALTTSLIALVGGATPDGRAHLIFARTVDLTADMNALLQSVLPLIDGKGGGRPNMAQGSGPRAEKLEEAINAALRAAQRGD